MHCMIAASREMSDEPYSVATLSLTLHRAMTIVPSDSPEPTWSRQYLLYRQTCLSRPHCRRSHPSPRPCGHSGACRRTCSSGHTQLLVELTCLCLGLLALRTFLTQFCLELLHFLLQGFEAGTYTVKRGQEHFYGKFCSTFVQLVRIPYRSSIV